MTEYVLILISAVLVNNFVLVQFLGLCPFMGVSNKIETAMGMSRFISYKFRKWKIRARRKKSFFFCSSLTIITYFFYFIF